MNRTTDSFAFDCAGWEGPVADISADQGTLSEDDDQEILNVSPFFSFGESEITTQKCINVVIWMGM